MKIFALDLAFTIGWAVSDGSGGSLDLRQFDLTPKKSQGRDWENMAKHFGRWLTARLEAEQPDILYVELPPAGLQGLARMVLLGLHWQCRAISSEMGVPMRSVAVPTVKKWATGNFRAKKPEMIKAAERLGWGAPFDDNHADAMLICAMALELNGKQKHDGQDWRPAPDEMGIQKETPAAEPA